MVRPLAAATAAALFLAACGDSNTSASALTTPFAGTIMGQPFTPAGETALVLSQPSTCTYSGTTATATGIALGFSTSTGLCPFVKQYGSCTNRANATTVSLLVLRANVSGTGTSPGPVQPGTYAVFTGALPAIDGQGNVAVAVADITKTGDAPTCTEPSNIPSPTGGTVRIDAISSTHVTGSADVTFSDGSRVAGSFDVPTCDFATDVCTALTCTTPACVQ